MDEKNLGVGLDVGTSTIISARKDDNGKIEYKKFRDAFIQVDSNPATLEVIKNLGVDYIRFDNNPLVVGDSALQLAGVLRKNARRPMETGVISSKDIYARRVLTALIQSTVGKPRVEKETCVFSVPAAPLGMEDEFDVTYHQQTIEEILSDLGFTPVAANEALCLLYSSLQDDEFTGLSASFGSGQSNTCIATYGITDKDSIFSVPRGGDWIDKSVANRFHGFTDTQITIKKEDQKDPVDILKDYGSKDDFKDAVSKYYETLIKLVVTNIVEYYGDIAINLGKPIPIVIGGGTSLIKGFKEVFENKMKLAKPKFEIKEIILADEPLYAVSRGALIRAAYIQK